MFDIQKHLTQQLLLGVLVTGAVLLLWEIAHYADNALSHKDRVLQSVRQSFTFV